MTDPASCLQEAAKQACLAREEFDPDSEEWEYAQKAAAHAESALVLLEGPDVLEDDVEHPGWDPR